MVSNAKLFHFTSVLSASTMYLDMSKTGQKSKYELLMDNFNLYALKKPSFREIMVPIVLSRSNVLHVYEEHYKFHLQTDTLYKCIIMQF